MATTPEFESFFARRCVWVNGPIIVGAGPSGLAVAACLREHGVPFVILERCDCIASLWQHRTYDRLKLHLPKQFCQLPKLAFPENFPEYPTRDQFVGYLQSYADKFDISPRFNETVLSARFDETSGLWRVRTSSEVEYICQSLVVATGENADSVVPDFEGMESFGGEVIHASDYKSGVGYSGKQVLVVGCGNSGMEVCLDLCHHGAFPSMVVRDSVHVLPREIMGRSTFELSVLMSRWIPLWLVDKILVFAAWLIFGSMSKYGLRRPAAGPLEIKKKEGKTPVLDLGALQKISSGDIKVVPAIKRFSSGSVELLDGRHVDVDSVVLATGYRSNVSSWLQDAGMFGKSGFPKASCPTNMWKGKNGLYAVGFNGRGLSGASLDAVKTAEDIASAWKEETRQTKRSTSCHRRCISQI